MSNINADAVQNLQRMLKRSALSKLTPEERSALGISTGP